MTEITLVIEDEMITVIDCKVVGARVGFIASGLTIYIDGSLVHQHPDCLNNLAMNACLERHIPLISLRRPHVDTRRNSFETNTKRMF
jgi:hypothetical protein